MVIEGEFMSEDAMVEENFSESFDSMLFALLSASVA